MPRSSKLYLNDIIKAIELIEKATEGTNYTEFISDEIRFNAVIRFIEVIGEAVKNIPEEIKVKYPDVEWKLIAGTRDRLIHKYFTVDPELVWEIVSEDITNLGDKIRRILKETEN